MRTCLGAIRKATEKFGLIENGDTVAVGVSGGKDSVALLYALTEYRRHFSPVSFDLMGICVDLGHDGFDITPVKQMAEARDIPFHVVKTNIAATVFDIRKEKNPCALCARLRKGTLIEEAKRHGANKIALGHHKDDLLETFLMSLVYEGKLYALQPKTYLSRRDVYQIRPFIFLDEKQIRSFAGRYALPVVRSGCPADGETKRAEAKELVRGILKNNPRARESMCTAIMNNENYYLW